MPSDKKRKDSRRKKFALEPMKGGSKDRERHNYSVDSDRYPGGPYTVSTFDEDPAFFQPEPEQRGESNDEYDGHQHIEALTSREIDQWPGAHDDVRTHYHIGHDSPTTKSVPHSSEAYQQYRPYSPGETGYDSPTTESVPHSSEAYQQYRPYSPSETAAGGLGQYPAAGFHESEGVHYQENGYPPDEMAAGGLDRYTAYHRRDLYENDGFHYQSADELHEHDLFFDDKVSPIHQGPTRAKRSGGGSKGKQSDRRGARAEGPSRYNTTGRAPVPVTQLPAIKSAGEKKAVKQNAKRDSSSKVRGPVEVLLAEEQNLRGITVAEADTDLGPTLSSREGAESVPSKLLTPSHKTPKTPEENIGTVRTRETAPATAPDATTQPPSTNSEMSSEARTGGLEGTGLSKGLDSKDKYDNYEDSRLQSLPPVDSDLGDSESRMELERLKQDMEVMKREMEILKGEAMVVARENKGLQMQLKRTRAELDKGLVSSATNSWAARRGIRVIWAGKSKMVGR